MNKRDIQKIIGVKSTPLFPSNVIFALQYKNLNNAKSAKKINITSPMVILDTKDVYKPNIGNTARKKEYAVVILHFIPTSNSEKQP
jgi:hypothetical protein